jgi:DNA-binding PadR family transcriptional regulator
VATGTLNPTSASLLGLLIDCGELTGGDLVRVAELRISGYWNLTRSQVYRELSGLTAAGYIAAGQTGPRGAQPFRVTPRGANALRAWLADEEPRDFVRIGLLLMLAFGRHMPQGRLQEVLDAYEERHRARLEFYEALDDDLAQHDSDPYLHATLAFGLHYERAVLQWLESLPPEIRTGTASQAPRGPSAPRASS